MNEKHIQPIHDIKGNILMDVCVDNQKNFLREQYGVMYEAGIAEGIRRCREAVEKKLSIYDDNEFSGAWEMNHGLKTALAAIDEVKGEKNNAL